MASVNGADERAVSLSLYAAFHSSVAAPSAAPKEAPVAKESAAAAPKEAKPKKEKTATPVVAEKKKYVPPPVSEAPRKRRAPLPGAVSPIAPAPGKKNVLITSALPYVNNVPHLGNIIGSTLSADVFARYSRQRGNNTLYICGTDEYGTATETKAAEEKLSPRQVCDKYFEQHKAIYDWFDISFDHFGRTSCPDPWSPDNKDWPQTQIAQSIFKDLYENNQLVEETVEQVFCMGCSKFLADRFIEGECPHCHYDDARGDQCDKCGKLLNAHELIKPRCKADVSHKVEMRTSKHLFLDLPKIEPSLREWIAKSQANNAWTENAIGITEGWLKKGLAPRCITRDLKWGTPVPCPPADSKEYSNKVFYVWFDAPIGYISITANYSPEGWKKWWQNPEDVSLYQFMGKDNVPFHTVIFPSSLIGSGKNWTLLSNLSTTEYLNYEGGKFSKSRGVGVFGDSAKETGIPSEVWRYYLLATRPESSDAMFTWKEFADKNNNELLKNLGNLVQRLVSFSFSAYGGKTPSSESKAPLNDRDRAFIAAVNEQLQSYITLMDAVKLRQGLFQVMTIGFEANKYVQDSAPWDLNKTDPARCATVVSLGLSAIRLLTAIAEPFMPGFTDKVLGFLNLEHAQIPAVWSPETATSADDASFIPSAHAINKPTPLFNNITEEQIEAMRAKFGGSQADQAAAAAAAGAAGGVTSPAAGGAGAGAAAAPAAKPAKGGAAGGKGGKAAGPAPGSDLPDAARIDVRVGLIKKVWPHPEAEKLWCEEIDLAEPTGPRKIASGLRQYYKAEEMEGRKVLVVANLKPRTMVGFESQGMVLCASNADRSVVEFVDPPAGSKVGERITIAGISEDTKPIDTAVMEPVNPAKKNNPWVPFAAGLKTDGSKVATFNGVPLMTSAGPCVAPTVADGPVS